MRLIKTLIFTIFFLNCMALQPVQGQTPVDKNGISLFAVENLFYSEDELDKLLHKQLAGKFAKENLFNQGMAEYFIKMGTALVNTGSIDNARIYYQLAHDIGLKLKDEIIIGKVFNNIGYIYMQKFDFKDALHWYLKSSVILRKYDHLKFELSICSRNLGDIYTSFGQYNQAIDWHLKTISLQEQLKQYSELTTSYMSLGNAYQDQGRYSEAMVWFLKALNNEKRWNRKEWLAVCQNNIGVNYYYQGEFDEALVWYLKAKEIRERLTPNLGLVVSYINIGTLYKTLENLNQALEWLEKGKNLAEKLGLEQELAVIYNDLGSVYLDKKQYEKSLSFHQLSIAIQERLNLEVDLTTSYNNIGTVKVAMGAFDDAIIWYQKAQQIQEKLELNVNLALTYNNLGNAHELKGQRKEALIWYHRSERLKKSLGNDFDLAGVYNNLALLFYYNQQWDSCLYYVSKNIKINEHLRTINKAVTGRQLYVNRSLEVIEAGVISAFNLNKEEFAFDLTEKAKARSFIDLLAESSIKNYQLPVSLESSYESIADQLNKVDKDLAQEVPKEYRKKLVTKRDSLFQLRRNLEDRIKATATEFAELVYPKIVKKKQLQSSLKEDEALVSFYTSIQNTYAFIITSKVLKMVNLGDSDSLLTIVNRYRKDFIEPLQNDLHNAKLSVLSLKKVKKDFFQTASALFQILWAPLEKTQLLRDKQLVIVPDGFLNYLPVETLIQDHNYQEDWNYQYLIKNYSITYSPSANVFHTERVKNRQEQNWTTEFLGVGVPNFSDNYCSEGKEIFGDLPHSISEVESIASHFQGRSKTITSEEATETFFKNLELKKYRYLHFSTHGVINVEQPDFSRILLKPSADSDGCLNLYEIFELDFHADLISISACEAGLGKLIRGEGIVGFSRALMSAGSSSLILSLWEVADVSTKDLFIQYYSSLAKGQIDKYSPLREAQLTMIKSGGEFANPFYWAPFIFIGEK